MDYKDIIAIAAIVVIIVVAMIFYPFSRFGMIGNYIKSKFSHKS